MYRDEVNWNAYTTFSMILPKSVSAGPTLEQAHSEFGLRFHLVRGAHL